MMTSLRNLLMAVTVIVAVAAFSSCGSKYNNTKFKDPNEGNTHVYGADSTQGADAAGAETPAK